MADGMSTFFLEGEEEVGLSPYAYSADVLIKTGCTRKRRGGTFRSSGKLDPLKPAWIYVGVGRNGRVKIGMSNDPERRCAGLGVRLHFTKPVTFEASRDVESRALDKLGRLPGQNEWTRVTPDEAVAAVEAAWEAVSRFRWTDPALTEEEARIYRIGLVIG